MFGFFAINDARLPFQYLFCITNAFQGLAIFLLHNIRDPKVIAWWRKVLHLKPLPDARSGSAMTGTYATRKTDYSRTISVSDYSKSISECDTSTITTTAIRNKPIGESFKSTAPLTEKDLVQEPPSKKYLQLEQSKLMHSSTESDESNGSRGSDSTAISEF